ncbi:MAG: hypothetical protein ACK2UM_14965 [Anaerolineales bacterium]
MKGRAGEFNLFFVLQGHIAGLPPRSPCSLLDGLLLLLWQYYLLLIPLAYSA